MLDITTLINIEWCIIFPGFAYISVELHLAKIWMLFYSIFSIIIIFIDVHITQLWEQNQKCLKNCETTELYSAQL